MQNVENKYTLYEKNQQIFIHLFGNNLPSDLIKQKNENGL